MCLIATYSQTFSLTLQQLPLRNQMSAAVAGLFSRYGLQLVIFAVTIILRKKAGCSTSPDMPL
jgi:hypothetical protein